MSVITSIWNVLFNNVLAQPAIFIGLIVVAGYALLKRKWYEIAAGFVRTVVGYMILQLGASSLKNTVQPLLDGIQQKWAMDAVVIDPNFGLTAAQSALESIGVTTSFAMITLLIAFVWNIILVFFRKYTKVRTLFTTGHIMVKQSTVATWIIFFLIPDLRNMGGIVLVGLLCGTYWSVFSNLTVEATQELTEGSGFAIGHQQMLGVPGEEQYIGNGISFCAICDGAACKDKAVLVLGGGNSAVEEAIYLAGFAGSVTVAVRSHLKADPSACDKLRAMENVTVLEGWNAVEFCGDGRLRGVRLKNGTTGEERYMECVQAFEYIGQIPATDCFKNLGVLNAAGYVEVDAQMCTKVPGVFAAGDCIVKELRQVITACADGAIAAQSAAHYIQGQR